MSEDIEAWGNPIETVPKDGHTVLLRTGMWFTVGSWNMYRNALCINAPGYPPYPHDEQPMRWMNIPRGTDPRDAVVAAARAFVDAWYSAGYVPNPTLFGLLRDLREALNGLGR